MGFEPTKDCLEFQGKFSFTYSSPPEQTKTQSMKGFLSILIILCASIACSLSNSTKGAEDVQDLKDEKKVYLSPEESCAGRCAKYSPDAICQCDGTCKESGDCCGDYSALCSVKSANSSIFNSTNITTSGNTSELFDDWDSSKNFNFVTDIWD